MSYRVARGRLGEVEGDDAMDVWEHIALAEWLETHPRPSDLAPVDDAAYDTVELDAASEWELTDLDDGDSCDDESW